MLNKAVLSDQCQQILSNHNCNVCSARFSPIPFFHMTGNMWTAKCSYINQLIAPIEFEAKMDQFLEYVLAMASRNDSTIPEPSDEIIEGKYALGMKRWALEHWIGSHPSIKPCDVCSDLTYGYNRYEVPKPSSRWSIELHEGPRHSLHRFRDGYFPHGDWFCGRARLLEFDFLYGSVPSQDSFFWSYYAHANDTCPNDAHSLHEPIHPPSSKW